MMNREDGVSIIMPAYNAELYIAQAISSVLYQTFENWELIVVDDGSTDSTLEIVFSFHDDRIRLIKQENSGVSNARNTGLNLAKGKYITFLDADDILPTHSLQARVEYLEAHSNVDIVDGRIAVKDTEMRSDIRIYEPYYSGKLLPRLLALDSSVFFGVVYMFKKEILGNLRFEENMTHSEDLLFYMQLSNLHSVQYGFVQEPVYWYRSGHTSAMANLDGLEKGYVQLLAKINSMDGVSFGQKVYIRLRVARIMFLSWLDRKELGRAVCSLFVVMNPVGNTR